MLNTNNAKLIEQVLNKKHQNQWCLVFFKYHSQQTNTLPFLFSIHHNDSQEWEEIHYLHSFPFLPHSWRVGFCYIPQHSDKISITSIQNNKVISRKSFIKSINIHRNLAALLLITLNPLTILKTIFGSPLHLKKRLRTALSRNYTNIQIKLSYKEWCSLYDTWEKEDKDTLYQSSFYTQWPVINFKIYNHSNTDLQETHKSTQELWPTPDKANQSYVVIIQNDEILSPHALAIFADQAARHHFPAALYADSDRLNSYKERVDPLFKPNVGYPTLLSGILTQDIWLVRKDIFDTYQKINPTHFHSAHAHRLALALYIWEQKLPIRHIPLVLSHRQTPLNKQTIKEIYSIASSHLIQQQWQGSIKTDHFPLKVALFSDHHPVSLVIPTTLSSKIILNSIQTIIETTNYPLFEVILVISQSTPLTRQQRYYLHPLKKYKNLRILWFKTNEFNFSESCNFGIQHTKYEFIGIINDDVRPKTSQWLCYMMGHMQDPTVGAVGAKLYYPNRQIQHAGIIMGAANLCEHAGRFSNSDRFNLSNDHDISAVTGACMIIRRNAYIQIQGFDKNYEIAYNDVDFCLKLRQANFRIIQCQNAELIHYESLSLGHHYTGKRAGKERQEILSIRSKWKAICDNDPFYNPNLSLQRGMDGKLAFPPRVKRPFITL